MTEFYPDFKLMKNYHNRHISKREFIESGTTYGRWNETLYQVKFYENDILIDSFVLNKKTAVKPFYSFLCPTTNISNQVLN